MHLPFQKEPKLPVQFIDMNMKLDILCCGTLGICMQSYASNWKPANKSSLGIVYIAYESKTAEWAGKEQLTEWARKKQYIRLSFTPFA